MGTKLKEGSHAAAVQLALAAHAAAMWLAPAAAKQFLQQASLQVTLPSLRTHTGFPGHRMLCMSVT